MGGDPVGLNHIPDHPVVSDNGVEPGTAFENIPDDWVCPECGVGKDDFEKAE